MKSSISLFTLLLFFICCSQNKESNLNGGSPDLIQTAREIIASTKTCALTSLGLDGYPKIRTMGPFPPEDDMTIWFATNPKSRKVIEIKNNEKVGLHYADKDDSGYVSLYGNAEIINDPEEKAKRWKDEWIAFYPDREESYILIKFTPNRLELISESRNLLGDAVTWTPEIYYFSEK
jgi:general stress protein 26